MFFGQSFAGVITASLADRVGITPQNLLVLKTGRARAIRFSTLEKLCEVLACQPGDLFAFEGPATTAGESADSDAAA